MHYRIIVRRADGMERPIALFDNQKKDDYLTLERAVSPSCESYENKCHPAAPPIGVIAGQVSIIRECEVHTHVHQNPH